MLQPNRWSRGGLEIAERCVACGSSERHPTAFERRDNEGYLPDVWRMVRCRVCESVWLDPRPDAQSLPRAYEQYYTHEVDPERYDSSRRADMARRLLNGYLNRRFKLSRQPAANFGFAMFSLFEPWRLKLDYYGRHLTRDRVGPPDCLLDIGCGNGAFLSRAAEMGWEVKGCEVDPKAVAACRRMGVDVLLGDAFSTDLKKESFGVITMSHVIEHVQDQSLLLKRAHDLLRPGGWLWLACPNPESIGLNLYGAAWSELHQPYHLGIPSQSILTKWLKDVGFSKINFLRRGAHARRIWKHSKEIALRQKLSIPSPTERFFWRLVADTVATFSPRRSEETVLLAQRPE